jgi:hypothetical protein
MSATTPQKSISDFLADTDKQYSSDVEKYTEGEKMAKKELDKAQAAYDKCNSELESHTETIKEKMRVGKPADDERTMDKLRRLMTNEKRAKNHLDHAQIRYDSIKRTLDFKLTEQMINRKLQANKSAARSSDSGAGVMSMTMPHVDPALTNLEVSRGAMAMAVPSQSDATSAQRSPSPTSPVGCWGRWCKSKKRDSSPSSKTAGGRKYKSKRFKTKRTYKKRRTSRK